jgi:hypothetical protein
VDLGRTGLGLVTTMVDDVNRDNGGTIDSYDDGENHHGERAAVKINGADLVLSTEPVFDGVRTELI